LVLKECSIKYKFRNNKSFIIDQNRPFYHVVADKIHYDA